MTAQTNGYYAHLHADVTVTEQTNQMLVKLHGPQKLKPICWSNPMRFAWGFAEICGVSRYEDGACLTDHGAAEQGVRHFSVACGYGCGAKIYAAELINVLRDNDLDTVLFDVTLGSEEHDRHQMRGGRSAMRAHGNQQHGILCNSFITGLLVWINSASSRPPHRKPTIL